MKTLITMFISLLMLTGTYGESPIKYIKNKVGNTDILKNWKVGDTKYINGVAILRVEGENANELAHLTNLFYTPKSLIMNLIDKKADLENLTASVKADMANDYEKVAPGGQVSLFYCRDEKRLANPASFSIYVFNNNGEQIYQKNLAKVEPNYSEEPYYYKSGIWFYYKTINIPKEVGETFSIQVIDKGLGTSYTFKVTGNNGNDSEDSEKVITTVQK